MKTLNKIIVKFDNILQKLDDFATAPYSIESRIVIRPTTIIGFIIGFIGGFLLFN